MINDLLGDLAGTGPLRRVVASPVRTEARALAASGALSVVAIAVDLARPWPLAFAVDRVFDGRPGLLPGVPAPMLLVGAGVATVLVTGVAGLVQMASERSGERAAERIGAALRSEVFGASLRLSLRWHGRVRSGELVSRLTGDVGRLLDAVVAATTGLVPDLLTVAGVLALLLVLDPRLALLGLLVVPVLALLSARQRRRVRASQTAARAAAGRLTGTATDLVRNVAAVQAFGRADHARRLFDRRSADQLATGLTAVDVAAGWRPRSELVLAVGAGLVLVVGGLGVVDGRQSTGHLLVVLAYLAELYAPVRGLTRLSGVLAKAAASADRVVEVLDSPDAVPEARPARPFPARVSSLTFRGVGFGYATDRPVLDCFDLHVRAGETVCLWGPSGIGKSTVLALLLRLWDVDRGRVEVDGIDVRAYDLRQLRAGFAYVPQDPWLLDATLAQNIAFGSVDATRAGVLAAGRTGGVAEFVERLPLGWDQPLGEGGRSLSGGQRRRVALARAAVSDASVLLLDEPTASLDAAAAAGVVAAVRAAATDRTTLLVTHDPQLAELADRVVTFHPTTPVGSEVDAPRPYAPSLERR